MEIEKIIPHPNYLKEISGNDIALLKLKRPVNNKNAKAISLSDKDPIQTSKVRASGWGRIEYNKKGSKDLLFVDLIVINNANCTKLLNDIAEREGYYPSIEIVSSEICGGQLLKDKGVCSGDSGGPLTFKTEFGKHILVGVTAWAIRLVPCGQAKSPGVFILC